MSCPDCERSGSKKTLWIALAAAIAVGAIGIAELTRDGPRGGAAQESEPQERAQRGAAAAR